MCFSKCLLSVPLLDLVDDKVKVSLITTQEPARRIKVSKKCGSQRVGFPPGCLACACGAVDDIAGSSEFGTVLSLFMQHGARSAAFISVLENGRLAKIIGLGAPEGAYFTQPMLQTFINLADVRRSH